MKGVTRKGEEERGGERDHKPAGGACKSDIRGGRR